jgi:hypothetical protein
VAPLTSTWVDILGVPVEIQAPEPLATELRGLLHRLVVAPAAAHEVATLLPVPGGFDVVVGDRHVADAVEPDIAGSTLLWHLNQVAIRSSPHLLVHAGAVVPAAGGGVVLLPGGSGAGKSTLTAACVAGGSTYVAEDLVGLDLATGLVVPYPRPHQLGDGPLVSTSSPGSAISGPMPPAAVVFPRYQPGAALVAVTLSTGWAMMALAAHSPNLTTHSTRGLGLLADLAESCPAHQVTHSDAVDVVPLVERSARRGRPLRPVAELPGRDDTAAVPVGDDVAVLDLRSGRLHLLDPRAADIWNAARAGLTAELQRRAADPNSVEASTLDRLREAGLLRTPGE